MGRDCHGCADRELRFNPGEMWKGMSNQDRNAVAKDTEYLRLLVAAQVLLNPTVLSEQETVYMCKFCVEYTNTASLVSGHSEESCPFKSCMNFGNTCIRIYIYTA